MTSDELIAGLPGESVVREGIADLKAGRRTVPACLVEIARTRLNRAGLVAAPMPPPIREPELELYRMLCRQGGDAYSRYNSMVRELVSFENALDKRGSKLEKQKAENDER